MGAGQKITNAEALAAIQANLIENVPEGLKQSGRDIYKYANEWLLDPAKQFVTDKDGNLDFTELKQFAQQKGSTAFSAFNNAVDNIQNWLKEKGTNMLGLKIDSAAPATPAPDASKEPPSIMETISGFFKNNSKGAIGGIIAAAIASLVGFGPIITIGLMIAGFLAMGNADPNGLVSGLMKGDAVPPSSPVNVTKAPGYQPANDVVKSDGTIRVVSKDGNSVLAGHDAEGNPIGLPIEEAKKKEITLNIVGNGSKQHPEKKITGHYVGSGDDIRFIPESVSVALASDLTRMGKAEPVDERIELNLNHENKLNTDTKRLDKHFAKAAVANKAFEATPVKVTPVNTKEIVAGGKIETILPDKITGKDGVTYEVKLSGFAMPEGGPAKKLDEQKFKLSFTEARLTEVAKSGAKPGILKVVSIINPFGDKPMEGIVEKGITANSKGETSMLAGDAIAQAERLVKENVNPPPVAKISAAPAPLKIQDADYEKILETAKLAEKKAKPSSDPALPQDVSLTFNKIPLPTPTIERGAPAASASLS